MKITQNKNISRNTIILLILAFILIASIPAYYLYSKYTNTDNLSTSQNDNDTQADNPAKDTNIKGTDTPATLPDNSQMITTDDIPVNQAASAEITRLEQKDSTVFFDAIIVGVSSIGRCVVSFNTPNDKPIVKEFDAKLIDNKYTCSFTTSALEFSYLGEWDVTLRYYYDQSQVITKGSVKIS